MGNQSNARDRLAEVVFAALQRLLGWRRCECGCDAGLPWTSRARVREAKLFCRCKAAAVREPEVQ